MVRDAYTLSLAAEAAVQQAGTQEAGTLTKELVMALRITASKINTRKVPKDEAHLGMGVGLLYVLNMWLKCVFKVRACFPTARPQRRPPALHIARPSTAGHGGPGQVHQDHP